MHVAPIGKASGKAGAVLGAAADDNDRAQAGQAVENGGQHLGKRRGNDNSGGPAVAKDVRILLGIKNGIERQRDNPGAQAAPERHRKIDRVVEQEGQSLLGPDADIEERGSKTAAARLELAISQRAVAVDEGGPTTEAARNRFVDEIVYGGIWPVLQQIFQHSPVLLPVQCPAAHRSSDLAAITPEIAFLRCRTLMADGARRNAVRTA